MTDTPHAALIDIPQRRANIIDLRAKATTDDERWICDEFARLFDEIDRLATALSTESTAHQALRAGVDALAGELGVHGEDQIERGCFQGGMAYSDAAARLRKLMEVGA